MDIVDFLFQAGALKDVPRSGWKTIGIEPESVSEHSYRTALIAYVIAKEEGVKDLKSVLLAALLHDLHETLITDVHLVAKKYVKIDEENARADTMKSFPEFTKLFANKEIMRIVRDADKLECIFQAKEYKDLGNKYTAGWIKNASVALKTESAKSVYKKAIKRDAFAWLFEARK